MNQTVQMGAHLDGFLERSFRRWGSLCARWPKTVLLTGMLVAAAFCCGIAMFEVITDPVLLWSAPTSRARLEKDYFDKHFTYVSLPLVWDYFN
jgi:Niemann-Pick C1 protein